MRNTSLPLAMRGLLVESLREPPAPAEAVEKDPAERRWQRVPLFAQLRALKP